MPYDPDYPPANVLIESVPMRAQFHGLKDLIDAVPTITSAQVAAVNTLPPGDPASVGISLIGSTLQLTFDIPAGQSGPPGEVTTAQMDATISAAVSAAIAGTAVNPTSVSPIGGSFADPDLNTVKNKLDELIAALFRAP